MNDVDDRLARLLDEAVPQPPRELDPTRLRLPAGRSRAGLLAPALAAAVVIGVAVVAVVLARGPEHGHPAAPPPVADATARQLTTRTVERVLAAAPVPPGAVPVDHAPAEALRRPFSQPASGNLIVRTRWWTAPGSMSEVLDWFANHLPAGLVRSGSGSGGGAGAPVQELDFGPHGPRWSRPARYAELSLSITVTPLRGGRVGARVDAQAIWLPERTAAQRIPLSVTSVDVVLDRQDHAPTVRRTLGARPARTLARVVNGLGVVPPGPYSCPVDFGYTDSLTFHDPQGGVSVRVDVGGCGFVRVGPDRPGEPTFGDGARVDQMLMRALGLPRDYGR